MPTHQKMSQCIREYVSTLYVGTWFRLGGASTEVFVLQQNKNLRSDIGGAQVQDLY